MADGGFKVALWAVTLLAVSGCSAPNPIMGLDSSTQTYASRVAWSDGLPAYSIRCNAPAPCQARILAICANRPYTTLASENMPSIGTRREVLGPPSIVARCN